LIFAGYPRLKIHLFLWSLFILYDWFSKWWGLVRSFNTEDIFEWCLQGNQICFL
jgi:hypothetical protein